MVDEKNLMQTYSVRLDPKIVERALNIVKKYGGKLSPFINIQLKKWVEEEEENENRG